MAGNPDASIALPFTDRPEKLTGELVGDVGFDPLGFSEEVQYLVDTCSKCVAWLVFLVESNALPCTGILRSIP